MEIDKLVERNSFVLSQRVEVERQPGRKLGDNFDSKVRLVLAGQLLSGELLLVLDGEVQDLLVRHDQGEGAAASDNGPVDCVEQSVTDEHVGPAGQAVPGVNEVGQLGNCARDRKEIISGKLI